MPDIQELADTLLGVVWTMLRVGGVVMLAPLLGAMFVPRQVRLLIAVVLAVALLPLASPPVDVQPLSGQGLFTIGQEMVVGFAIGFVLRLATEAALLAGQLISTGMGLSFATVVDPQNGGMPLLGRFYIIVASLLLLATNAHLSLIALLGQSFAVVPIGSAGFGAAEARAIVEFGAVMFAGAVQLALPSVVAILMVNVAFGVISRSAPALNLFAVGFPVTILLGLFILVLSIRTQGPVWESQMSQAFALLAQLLGG
ncbi:MAG: flagellar biosynthetic protein FliR [Gammaproteobacteria bacterium]|nr:flagellar biosynthetic protein FliR [Gammaproteobacteria bacterium]